ncbi:hypothetical protein TCAP_04396 [Tolypocladium capitatum]|uniref:Uncharacterized protein n=1 Tax=Tolypocladium capitatum TaxID=45235 RepID=A0A2K3QDR3_9HYPO|nr:hypothetical protein TCAP_04396 [Tolypocladium capitatum]
MQFPGGTRHVAYAPLSKAKYEYPYVATCKPQPPSRPSHPHRRIGASAPDQGFRPPTPRTVVQSSLVPCLGHRPGTRFAGLDFLSQFLVLRAWGRLSNGHTHPAVAMTQGCCLLCRLLPWRADFALPSSIVAKRCCWHLVGGPSTPRNACQTAPRDGQFGWRIAPGHWAGCWLAIVPKPGVSPTFPSPLVLASCSGMVPARSGCRARRPRRRAGSRHVRLLHESAFAVRAGIAGTASPSLDSQNPPTQHASAQPHRWGVARGAAWVVT